LRADPFHPDEGGDICRQDLSFYNSHTTSHPKRRHFSYSPPRKPEIQQNVVTVFSTGGRSVGIVRSRTKGHGVCLFVVQHCIRPVTLFQGTASEATLVALLGAKAKALRRAKQDHPEWSEAIVISKLVGYASSK
jgi:hypothetical protein